MSDDWLAAADGVSDGARAAWREVVTCPLPEGFSRELTSKGFIAHDLRFRRGDDWMFSAVLNEGWVLWYVRRPAIRAGLVEPQAMLARFPDARLKPDGELALRLHDGAAAAELTGWCLPA